TAVWPTATASARSCATRLDLMEWGPRHGPHTPTRSEAPRQGRGAPRPPAHARKRPGKAVALLDLPHTLGSAPARPWRSSTSRTRSEAPRQGRGAPRPPPHARKRPGKAVAL